jgi:hypothetical protein
MARTEARLDATGAVTRRSAGPLEIKAGSRSSREPDWAPVDATTEVGIERQAAFDNAEAAKDAAVWVRRVRRRADCHRPILRAGSAYLSRPARLGTG